MRGRCRGHPRRRAAINAAERAAFQVARDAAGDEVQLGDAGRSRIDGSAFFPIVRRLMTPAGDFDGTVSARGRIDYFQQFYRDVQPDPSHRVALLHRNGTLLARHPPMDEALGRRLPMVAEMLAASGPGAGAVPVRTQ